MIITNVVDSRGRELAVGDQVIYPAPLPGTSGAELIIGQVYRLFPKGRARVGIERLFGSRYPVATGSKSTVTAAYVMKTDHVFHPFVIDEEPI